MILFVEMLLKQGRWLVVIIASQL